MKYRDMKKDLKLDSYRMKSIKWYQRIKIFFACWYITLKNIKRIINGR